MSWKVSESQLKGHWQEWTDAWHTYATRRGFIADQLHHLPTSKTTQMWLSEGLSPRLAHVAQAVLTRQGFADIGTDHAHLPYTLVRRQQVPFAFGIDVNKKPLETAYQNLKNKSFSSAHPLILLQGDGFTPWTTLNSALKLIYHSNPSLAQSTDLLHYLNSVTTVSICGVGGQKINQMLLSCPPSVQRVIVQPNLHHQDVKRTLIDQRWIITQERLSLDQGRLFLTFIADRHSPQSSQFHKLRLSQDPLYPLWAWVRIESLQKALKKMPSHLPKAKAYETQLSHLRLSLQECLSQE